MSTEGSKAFALNTKDLLIVAKNALLVGGAAALAVVGQNLNIIDLGPYTPVVVPVITIGLDSLIRWMRDNSK
jgi:hypothetical protein